MNGNMVNFKNPEINYWPRPLFFWNDKPDKKELVKILHDAKKCGYGGVGVIAYEKTQTEYLSEEYFDLIKTVLETSKALDLKVCLYDEWGYPSGNAGGLLKKRYPEACASSLEYNVFSLNEGENHIPQSDGTLMAAVAFEENSYQRIDIKGFCANGKLVWDKAGNWEAMFFYCRQSDWDRVNYLDPEAVKKFISITHREYYKRFSEYFGNVIDTSFYDEPQFYSVNGKMWTADFNEKFFKSKGYDPSALYPALIKYIGRETAWARAELFGFRAELYAQGFPKVIGEWCKQRGILLTGHVDQEEVKNPCGITGDLMKSFKYQDIPGVDEILYPGRGSKIYKIISSAAYNWDKRQVMVECFGAMGKPTKKEMYGEAMDLFVKGINFFVPHAIWYNDKKDVKSPPELSLRDKCYGKMLPEFNKFCARLSSMLQQGGHVSSVAVLYPIEGLMSQYSLDWGGHPATGGPAADSDYQEIGEYLFYQCNCDFTFLHPETLDEKCFVKDNLLKMKSDIHYQSYSVVILTGQETISVKSLRKLKEFYLSGGTVIAASRMPLYSAEKGFDGEVHRLLKEIFGVNIMPLKLNKNTNDKGGEAWCIPQCHINSLYKIIKDKKSDIIFEKRYPQLGYIHKRVNDSDIYYFVNGGKGEKNVAAACVNPVKSAKFLNPRSGEIYLGGFFDKQEGKIKFSLPGQSSIFIITE